LQDLNADADPAQLVDLRAPPVDINAALNVPTSAAGVMAAALGESPEEAARRIEAATKGATDLTSMVRKKEKKTEAAGAAGATNGKRKAEDDAEAEGKKAKVEEK
jgi:HAT1-interacting factor 1